MLSIFRIGKTHIPHRKNTADMPAERMAPPAVVSIPMVHHIGAPAAPIVKVGDKVSVGTKIAEAGGYVSCDIHSSVSGVVKKIDTYLMQNGQKCPLVVIESDGEMKLDESITPPHVTSFKELSEAVRASGLVGLGGAGFPTHVKLDEKRLPDIDTIVINAAECEPYITADTRTMLDAAGYVKSGLDTLMRLSGISRAVIGIEANKPKCIEGMCELFADNDGVEIVKLPSTYPQGAEKVLIYNSTGKVVPEGKLPADVGVLLLNVTTLAFIAKYLETGIPLVEKCISVDGSAVSQPKNMIVPVGASMADVFAAAGGFSEEPKKILYGGPMMGVAVYTDESPILKNTNAILAFSEKEAKIPEPTPCIHCGRCVSACPIGLNPTIYAKSMNVDDKEERAARLEDAKLSLCMECGSCSYVCPAKRPLVENNRLSKAFMKTYYAAKRELQEKGEKK